MYVSVCLAFFAGKRADYSERDDNSQPNVSESQESNSWETTTKPPTTTALVSGVRNVNDHTVAPQSAARFASLRFLAPF